MELGLNLHNWEWQLTSLDWNNFVIAKNASVASVLPIGSPCTHQSLPQSNKVTCKFTTVWSN